MHKQFDLPVKRKTDICTIMYTSGTTGDPKGVMISNESILSIISGVNHHLEDMNEEVTQYSLFSFDSISQDFTFGFVHLLVCYYHD